MGGEDAHHGESGEDGVGAEQVEDVAGEDVRGVQRQAVDEVCQRECPDERGAGASDRVRPQPAGAPAGVSRFSRHSKETTRTISRTRITKSAMYRPENIVAYQAGKAAKVAPAATTSQTSLPSHTGPIDWNIRPRSRSSRGRTGSSIPTPKSNPSSRK